VYEKTFEGKISVADEANAIIGAVLALYEKEEGKND
jgi:hypothetical protein